MARSWLWERLVALGLGIVLHTVSGWRKSGESRRAEVGATAFNCGGLHGHFLRV